ncbi:MAG: MBL fold metallo-hydrolase [Candidatus Hydrogenedentota bacterium]
MFRFLARVACIVAACTVLICITANGQQGALQRQRQLNPADGITVVLIGTGIPLPNPQRGTAATLVIAGDRSILVDTGRECMVGLSSAGLNDVSMVLYTHYHSDHIAGLGELLVNRGINGAEKPLPVIGPMGAKRAVDGFREAYALETSYRVAHHGDHWPAHAMDCDVQERNAGVVYDEGDLKITMFDVDHEPVVPAVGYRFDFKGQSVVVSGDTKKTAKTIEMAKDCDILVHEATDLEMLQRLGTALKATDPRRAAMLSDMLSHHTSTTEAAEVARDANVKKLVLTHLVPSIPPEDGPEKNFIRGMADIYKGPIVVGRDGMEIRP